MSDLTARGLNKKGIGSGNGKPFSRLAAVRQLLQEHAEELYHEYRNLAREAVAQGKPDVAAEIIWNLIDAMPKDEGLGMVDARSSKPPKELTSSSPATPSIQIGVILGNQQQPQHQLPPLEVIDVTPRKGEHESRPAQKVLQIQEVSSPDLPREPMEDNQESS